MALTIDTYYDGTVFTYVSWRYRYTVYWEISKHKIFEDSYVSTYN